MEHLKQIALFVLVGLMAVVIAACSDDTASEPIVEDAWARPGTEGNNSAAYMTIENDGDEDLILTGASGDVARAVEVHESTTEDGMMEMNEVEEVVVPAGDSLALEPGGHHVMMMSINQDLEPGDTFTLNMQFDGLDDVEVDVTVEEQ